MSSKSMIQIENVTKTFNSKEILKDLNISVEAGTIYGLLGENGAGKTTTFKILAGLLSPTAGTVKIQGNEITGSNRSFLKNMGILIETPVFYEHLSAKENLEVHLDYMGCDKDKIGDTLAMVGLKDTGKQPVSQFSLGMKQRLAIARAISHLPKILVLDEPINGLDPMGIRQMRGLFSSLAADYGMTIIISSHILSEIEHIANKIGVLAGGTIVQEVSLAEIKEKYADGLEDYFFDIMSGGGKA